MGKRKLRKNKNIDNSKSCKSSIHDVAVGLNTDIHLTERLYNFKTNKGFSVKALRFHAYLEAHLLHHLYLILSDLPPKDGPILTHPRTRSLWTDPLRLQVAEPE